MRTVFYYLLATILIGCNSSEKEQDTFYSFENDAFHYSGRYETTEEGLALVGSAASVRAKVYGDSCVVFLQSGNNQYQYVSIELNEGLVGRFRINNDSILLALPDNDSGGTLAVYKDTEAANGAVIFNGIRAEKIEPVSSEEKPKIEFIGNSITCGMGADTRKISCEDGEWYDQHNAYLAYGPRVARALNADFEISCVSGMGMYRNWNDEDQPVMPDVYSNLYLNSNSNKKADFNGEAPDVVSIALGTNDLSFGDGEKERTDFDAEKFTKNYIGFVENIFSHYPETKIALLSSPMVGENENEKLIACLKNVEEHFGNKEIAIFEFEKMEPQGCSYHPDLEDHEEMAASLIPFFKKLINQ